MIIIILTRLHIKCLCLFYAGELTELFLAIYAKRASAEVNTHQLLTNGG